MSRPRIGQDTAAIWATVYTWKCSSLTIDVRSRQLMAVNRLGRGRLSAGSCAYIVAWF